MKQIANKRWFSIVAATFAACATGISVPAWSQGRFVMDDNQFNQWVFSGSGKQLDEGSEISLALEALDRTCHLNDSQKEKLRLAGRGDYARFEQQIEQLRSELVGKSYDQNEISKMYQRIQPLTARYQAGLLGDESLFSKVAHSSLSPEQQEQHEAAQLERRQARHNAKVRLFVAMFEQSCPMTATQRDSLVELLLKETRPANRASEYDWYVVVIQVGKIPDEKLNIILDDAQLTFLRKSNQQARAMERHLQQIGVLPK